MKNFSIPGTNSTPEIHLDAEKNLMEISGESYPENSFEFYAPVIKWIRDYVKEASGFVQMNINLVYLNTSSTRCLIEILDELEKAFQNGKNIKVTWFYEEGNDRAAETAEEFKEDLTIPFQIVPVKE